MLVKQKPMLLGTWPRPERQRSQFRADSFYVAVVDGLHIQTVRQAATMIKNALSIEGGSQGTLALEN